MSAKSTTAKLGAARSLQDKARNEASLGHNSRAAESYLKAGKLFLAGGARLEAEQAWRRACEFAEREARRIARMSEPSNLN